MDTAGVPILLVLRHVIEVPSGSCPTSVDPDSGLPVILLKEPSRGPITSWEIRRASQPAPHLLQVAHEDAGGGGPVVRRLLLDQVPTPVLEVALGSRGILGCVLSGAELGRPGPTAAPLPSASSRCRSADPVARQVMCPAAS
jgi:hypothetical protein